MSFYNGGLSLTVIKSQINQDIILISKPIQGMESYSILASCSKILIEFLSIDKFLVLLPSVVFSRLKFLKDPLVDLDEEGNPSIDCITYDNVVDVVVNHM